MAFHRNVRFVHIPFDCTRIHKNANHTANRSLFLVRHIHGSLDRVIVKADPFRHSVTHQTAPLQSPLIIIDCFINQFHRIIPQYGLPRHHLRHKGAHKPRMTDVRIFEYDIAVIECVAAIVKHRADKARIPDISQGIIDIQVRNLVTITVKASFKWTDCLPISHITTANRT